MSRAPAPSDRFYRFVAAVVHPLLRAWFPVSIEGAEHIPATGPVILAANHRSNADPPLLSMVTSRPVRWLAKEGLFRGPLGTILHLLGQVPVRRGGSDREALRACQEVVERGGVLGLFPEGTRCDGRFTTIHPGLAYILVRTNCPVVPVVLTGTERIRRRFGWLPRMTPVRMVAGPPLELPPPRRGRDARREASEALRRQLQAFVERVDGPAPERASGQASGRGPDRPPGRGPAAEPGAGAGATAGHGGALPTGPPTARPRPVGERTAGEHAAGEHAPGVHDGSRDGSRA